ncbi:MAG: SAM-dependent methyltransferase [Actinobacteria bacterium]|nr:SAM-dependent methyltransferase [Actinomycetota bacterium]
MTEPQTPDVETGWAWVDDAGDWLPPAVRDNAPSAARMYDYYLGGKDNMLVDREAADQVIQVVPDARDLAVENRGFLARAVRTMAEAGIDQFIDLGSGLPTSPNVHEIAREVHPNARVAYVDRDPLVLAHSRARVAVDPLTRTVVGDLRMPGEVLARPDLGNLIDFGEPVGILLIAVLHFVDHVLAPEVVRQYVRPLVTGSMVAISAGQSEGADKDVVSTLERVYEASPTPVYLRTRAQIGELFGDLQLIEPGLADITQWRKDGTPGSMQAGCGVAVKV